MKYENLQWIFTAALGVRVHCNNVCTYSLIAIWKPLLALVQLPATGLMPLYQVWQHRMQNVSFKCWGNYFAINSLLLLLHS